jgi:hypothetical protein
MIRIIAASVLTLPLLSACVVINAPLAPELAVSTNGMPGALEPIHAAAFINDRAIFRVSSGGCTSRSDIEPVVTRVSDHDAVVTLRRINDDHCEAYLRDGVEVSWTFAELGLGSGEKVRVNNPYLLPPSD